MARRFHPRSTPEENLRMAIRSNSWKVLLLAVVLIILIIPVYRYAARIGGNILPGATQFFYKMTSPVMPTPTAMPTYLAAFPQVGSVLYTVLDGDSCDGILTDHMNMIDASQTFSDANPNTVSALDSVLGKNCHALQPGMVVPLSPQYPLVAFGGKVLKITATSPQQLVPTPLINVPGVSQSAPDCANGCLLTLQVGPQAQVRLAVQTELVIHIGSWVWAQAMLPQKKVSGFSNYPYTDARLTFNNITLRACDLQVDDTHDDNSLSCDQLTPNTIDDDGGAWMYGVAGASGLGHWKYPLHLATGTQVLLWLTVDKDGNLKYQAGNPIYRYNADTHVYVKV